MIKIEIAKPVAKKLKILFYGPSGSGKTIAALSFPRVLMIDAEAGSDLYAGRPGVAEFYRVRAKTISEVNEVLDAIEKDNGKTWDTLVIDPVTVLYDVEKNVGSANNTKDMDFRSWARVNNRMSALYNRLTALNTHVVIIAREAVEYAGEGLNLRKIGVKPEADKKLVYMLDFVVHLKTDHSGEVEKSRGVILGKDGNISKIDWKAFEPTANMYVSGETVKSESDEEAATKEMNKWENGNVTEWVTKWTGQGMTTEQLMQALKITGRWGNWKGTVTEADAAVEAHRKPVSVPPSVTAAQASHSLRTTQDINDPDAFDKVVQTGVEASKKVEPPATAELGEAELRLAVLKELENQLVHIYYVEKRDYVSGRGKVAGSKWLAKATFFDSTEDEQKIEFFLWPEDVTAIKAARHDFPEKDYEVYIPVVLTIKDFAVRIKGDKVPKKDNTPIDESKNLAQAMLDNMGKSKAAANQFAEKV